MARPLRILEPGLTYHVHGRGNGRMAIYLDDRDRKHFLDLLADVVDRFHLHCHAFCLMTNHYHVVITTRDANLSAAMHALNGEFGQWWDRRHDRVGHVFQGRFGAKVVQADTYLLTVCRYVVLNPVRHRVVEAPGEWPWSSYRATAGLEPVPRFLDPEPLWLLLGGAEGGSRRYRDFVGDPQVPTITCRGAVIGDEDFIRRFDAFFRRASREVPKRERQIAGSLRAYFEGVFSRAARNDRIVAAHLAGYSRAEIGRFLELDVSTVNKILAGRPDGSDVDKAIDT